MFRTAIISVDDIVQGGEQLTGLESLHSRLKYSLPCLSWQMFAIINYRF